MADKQLGITVASVAGFQLLAAWNANAPSLRELRDAPPGDVDIARKLYDADILVGGTALILGGAIAYMTKDATALLLMGVTFVSVSVWHHAVLQQGEI